jgi:DNA-directed RNA polymerase alpha subunit
MNKKGFILDPILAEWLDLKSLKIPLDIVGKSKGLCGILQKEGINTYGDILDRDASCILKIKGLGRVSLRTVFKKVYLISPNVSILNMIDKSVFCVSCSDKGVNNGVKNTQKKSK